MDINGLLRGESLNQMLGRVLPEGRLVRELLAGLRPGQTLQAQVLTAPGPDVARLLIQDVPLSARTARPLVPGQLLSLEVLEGGDTPQLRVLDPQRAPGGQDVLRLALPRQLPLAETLEGLSAIAGRALPLLPTNAREALLALLARSIPLPQLSGERLRQALQDSGLFTEARLAQGQPPSPGDRKGLLLRLAASLPWRPAASAAQGIAPGQLTAAGPERLAPLDRALLLQRAMTGTPIENHAQPAAQAAPPNPEQQALERLWRLVDASLARIQTHQAASLPHDDQLQKVWQLDIPLALPGLPPQAVELRIEPEVPGAEDAAEAGWLVTIGFLFAELGPVKAGVRLANGSVSTTFWCEQAAAVRRFEQQLPRLQAALEAAGLKVSHLAASQGMPPVRSPAQPTQRLLDERV